MIIEVEQLKGERKYYDNRLALGTLGVTLFEAGALRASSGPTVGEAFGDALRVLSTSIAWLVYIVTFLVPWVAFTIAAWFLVRYVRRFKGAA